MDQFAIARRAVDVLLIDGGEPDDIKVEVPSEAAANDKIGLFHESAHGISLVIEVGKHHVAEGEVTFSKVGISVVKCDVQLSREQLTCKHVVRAARVRLSVNEYGLCPAACQEIDYALRIGECHAFAACAANHSPAGECTIEIGCEIAAGVVS